MRVNRIRRTEHWLPTVEALPGYPLESVSSVTIRDGDCRDAGSRCREPGAALRPVVSVSAKRRSEFVRDLEFVSRRPRQWSHTASHSPRRNSSAVRVNSSGVFQIAPWPPLGMIHR